MKSFNRLTFAVVTIALSAVPAVYAAPASISPPIHAMFSETKLEMVKFSLRNDSGSSMEVKVGDEVMTLVPGKPVSLKLPVGTRIVAVTATEKSAAGSLIEQVMKEHSGATIVIH
jgi:hypothetical protein